MKVTIQRNPAFELIRIIAMSMILVHHLIDHTLTDDAANSLWFIVNGFLLDGVNLFFLLSGYFQINLKWGGVAKLLITTLLISVFSVALLSCFTGEYSISSVLSLLFFPISKCPYWFIQVYFILMIISPILNRALNGILLRDLRVWIIILSFVELYSCGLGHNIVNKYGYSLYQAVYMYLLGSWIHRDEYWRTKYSTKKLLSVFICMSLISGIGIAYIGSWQFIEYNGLPVLFSSVCLFVIFTRIKVIETDLAKIINRFGSAALIVYLLHDGVLGNGYVYQWIRQTIVGFNSSLDIVVFFSFVFVLTWLIALIIDYIISIAFSGVIRYLSLKLDAISSSVCQRLS